MRTVPCSNGQNDFILAIKVSGYRHQHIKVGNALTKSSWLSPATSARVSRPICETSTLELSVSSSNTCRSEAPRLVPNPCCTAPHTPYKASIGYFPQDTMSAQSNRGSQEWLS